MIGSLRHISGSRRDERVRKNTVNMFREIFKFLASLKLALLLLSVIIVASMMGTFYESGFNAEVAKKYIYNAPWFNVWLGLLCINLFSVAAIRYPWKPHQTGFVITHAGIIILLIGGMIDRQYGIEGNVRLNRGQPATNVLELPEEDLLVSVNGESAKTKLIAKSMVTPGDFKINIASPSNDVKVEIVDKFPPLIQLVMQGLPMGRFEKWMFLPDSEDLGPVSLFFRQGTPPIPAPPPSEEERKQMDRSEWHFVYAKYQPMVHTLVGKPTHAEAKLLLDDSGKNPHIDMTFGRNTFDIEVTPNIGKPYTLRGMPGWTMLIKDYFPNFKMENGKPVNVNDNPENPTVIFELHGPPDNPNLLAVYLGPDGKLRYFMKNRWNVESAGEMEPGKNYPGFMPGTEFGIQEFIPSGLTKIAEEDSKRLRGVNFKELNERNGGLMLRVSAKGESRDVWVSESLPQEPDYQKVEVGGQSVSLALPHRAIELPFYVGLERFVARHQEGREGAGDYETYESTLSFGYSKEKQLDTVRLKPDSAALKEWGLSRQNAKGEIVCSIIDMDESSLTLDFADLPSKHSSVVVPKSEVADFFKRTQKISMNRPTTFPETWYGPWTGVNYKFSQAGMDASMPDYSGVQVLRDPGWAPKWIGCIMICFGIFTMFYLKPYFHGRREVKAAAAAVKPGKAESGGKTRRAENLAAGD